MALPDRLREAHALFEARDFAGAVRVAEALLPELTAVFGGYHEYTLDARVLVARACNGVDASERSLALARAVLPDIETHLGPGHPLRARAQFVLGMALDLLGRGGEAEEWYRRAAEAGDRTAMASLGDFLIEAGDLAEAERWLRHAASAGDPDAVYNLGYLLHRVGNSAEAEYWLRQAADAGGTDAMNTLGALLQEAGNSTEAERWYRHAIGAGDIEAMYNLARLLHWLGRVAEAQEWFRRAEEATHR